MARKLKTYQTSLGFFDLAIAALSMKAALEAWGADSNLFHQGAAKESDDPEIIAAAMANPGVVLRAPGWNRPTLQRTCRATHRSGRRRSSEGHPQVKRLKDGQAFLSPCRKATERQAALAYEREQTRRE